MASRALANIRLHSRALVNMSMMDKAKAAASSAGDAVKVKAIEAQIMVKQNTIKTYQSEMGVKLYPVLAEGGDPKPIFEEYRAKVAAVEKEIADKEAEKAAIGK